MRVISCFPVVMLVTIGSFAQNLPPRDRPNQQTPTTTSNDNSTSAPQPAQSPSTPQSSSINNSETRPKQADSNQDTRNIWEKAFAPELWSNWALAVVGLGGIVVAAFTLRAIAVQAKANQASAAAAKASAETANAMLSVIKEQGVLTSLATDAAMKGATAAKASADSIINTERAWLLVSIETADMPRSVSVTLTNHGRTPAWIMGVAVELITVVDKDNLATFDHTAPTKTNDTTERVVPANGTEWFERPLDGHMIVSGKAVEAANRNQVALLLRGVVTYKDLFNIEHRTAFCWRCNRTFTMASPIGSGLNEQDHWRFDNIGPPEANVWT